MVTSEKRGAVSELGLADSGKLLVMFYGAREPGTHIEENYLDSYVYLLSAEGVLDFKYPFRFVALTPDSAPLPYSFLLRGELENLIHAEFVGRGSRVYLAPLGKRWVEDEVAPAVDFPEVLKAVSASLKKYAAWDYSQLFQAIYSKL